MKIGIIGSGFVGATAAYAIMMRKGASEIVLIDRNENKAKAEAADIRHASPFVHPVNIYAGSYKDLKFSDLIIITAGISQKPGQSRLELLQKNAEILKDILHKVMANSSGALILIATNPVDIMTHIAVKYAEKQGFPEHKIFGTGTTLDTARFRSLLGNHIGVDPNHVHGYVIGEHGDSEVLTWSIVDIGGLPLEEFAKLRDIPFDKKIRDRIDDQVRHAAYHIIEGKGSTYYGIGGSIARIVDIISHDQRAFITICSPQESIAGIDDVTLAMPHLVGKEGILSTLPFHLNEEETSALRKSAEILKKEIEKVSNFF